MNATETICQCTDCSRFFADREGVRVLVPPPEQMAEWFKAPGEKFILCAWPDCGAIKAKNESRRPCRRRSFKSLPARTVRGPVRSSCPPDTEPLDTHGDDGQPVWEENADRVKESAPVDAGNAETKPDGATVPGLMSAGARQADFKASGAAKSANARLIEFFDFPHNFDKWFSRTSLKEIARNDLINNRADDLREYYVPKGFYVDNYMIADGPELPKTSHYRVCRIEDALSLTRAEKFKLINGYDMPAEGQKTF